MYKNIGRKIKAVAKFIGFSGIGISIIAGLVLLFVSSSQDEAIYIAIGILVVLLGSIISWASTIALYGFGQLVENTDILVQQNINIKVNYHPNNYEAPFIPQSNPQYYRPDYHSDNYSDMRNVNKKYCANCGKIVTGKFCPSCGSSDLKNIPIQK